MPTLLCVPILVLDEHTALADAAAARDAGADLVEFRIDEFFTGAADPQGRLNDAEVRSLLRLVAECPLPCIVTCRLASESGGVGGYDGDNAARAALYERLGTAGPSTGGLGAPLNRRELPPRYLDIEYASYVQSPNLKQQVNIAVDHPPRRRDVRAGLVLSMHDFEGRPRDLLRRVSLMQSEPAASVVKVAYAARSIRDNLELFDLLQEGAGGRPMIALGIGRFGLMSRVLAPKFGGFLTFASLRESAATAPGQPTIREMLDVYRFKSITPRTRVYGVVGWPVEHSLGPLVHNDGFESLAPDDDSGPGEDFDGVYLPLPVPPEWEHFKATLSALIDHPALDFCGCSVTAPHKQHLVRLAREAAKDNNDEIEWSIDDLSDIGGAANTLVVDRDGAGLARKARVLNTDAPAAAECLGAALGDLSGKRVAVVGAGGVARAIALGLLARGASVSIHNRGRDSADRLVSDLNSARRGRLDSGELVAADLDDLYRTRVTALVNATPVGMKGGPDPNRSPVSVEHLCERSADAVVFDTVYNPLRTPLLEQATLAGMRTIDGVGMFVRQAAAQFAAWTGRPAPACLFERVCREALGEQPGL